MGFTNFISEAEAMHVCGVSAKTLSRFAEAGYLSIEKESDGLTLYSSDELEKVFGKSVVAKRSLRRNGAIAPRPSPTPLKPDSANETHIATSDTAQLDTAASDTAASTAEHLATEREHIATSEDNITPQNASKKENLSEAEHSDSQQKITEDTSQETDTSECGLSAHEPTSTTSSSAMSSSNCDDNRDVEEISEECADEKTEQTASVREAASLNERDELIQLRADKAVLERINEVNEKIIELREERIQEVSKERDWLRERVEKLEQKAERDQILLMSETQLLRQVMEQNALQRSPVRKALEWIGLIDPPKSPFQSGKERVVLSE